MEIGQIITFEDQEWIIDEINRADGKVKLSLSEKSTRYLQMTAYNVFWRRKFIGIVIENSEGLLKDLITGVNAEIDTKTNQTLPRFLSSDDFITLKDVLPAGAGTVYFVLPAGEGVD